MHPARYSSALIETLHDLMGAHRPVLDPMAGVGSSGIPGLIHGELEPEWARQCPAPAYIGDATRLPFAAGTFAAVVCSPAYGNRMADSYAGDGTPRQTYRIALGRPLSERNGAGMQWGDAYRRLHAEAWAEVRRVLRPGGVFVLNVKDHIRGGRLQNVPSWHADTCWRLGFHLAGAYHIPCPGFRYGRNSEARVRFEHVLQFVAVN